MHWAKLSRVIVGLTLLGLMCAVAQPTNTVTVVDVMILYTPSASTAAGGSMAMQAKIQDAMREANLVFLNSQLNARLRLVHCQEITYEESGSVSNDLARLRMPNDGFLDEVHSLRDQYAADLICLVTETGGDYLFYGLQGPSAANAFSIVRRSTLTGRYFLPVTLSFNFGCQLERPYADSLSAFPYSYGYTFISTNDGLYYGTVDSLAENRLPWFSNPNILFQGFPSGAREGNPWAADNARTINQTAPLLAGFRAPVRTTTLPSVRIVSPSGTISNPFCVNEETNLAITVEASDADGFVQRVDLYSSENSGAIIRLLGSSSNTPATFVWSNVPAGNYTMFAVAVDDMQATRRSEGLVLSVAPVPPRNDNFTNAIVLTGTNVSVSGRTTTASLEEGEPAWTGDYEQFGTVWYSWRAPGNGRVVLSMADWERGAVFGATIGDSVSNLTMIANNWDWWFPFREIGFDVMAGTNYYIYVAGWVGTRDLPSFTLELAFQPTFAVFLTIPTAGQMLSTNNILALSANATVDEPAHMQRLEFYCESQLLGVVTNTGLSPERMAPNLDLVPYSGPENDQFTNRTSFVENSVLLVDDNSTASSEPGEFLLGGADGKTVWYSWTAPSNGTVVITRSTVPAQTSPNNLIIIVHPHETNNVPDPPKPPPPREPPGQPSGPLVGVHTGDVLSNLTLIASNNVWYSFPKGGGQWRVLEQFAFSVTQGITCQISVDSCNGSAGQYCLEFDFLPPPPNDVFSNSIVLSGTNVSIPGYNFQATKEAGEPDHAGQSGGASVWWTWTAPQRGLVSIETVAAFTPLLGIYIGDTLTGLTPVTNGSTAVSFYSEAGVTYRIAVDGASGAQGVFASSLRLSPAPPNDHFANRIQLTGTQVVVGGSTAYATHEDGEPWQPGSLTGHSLWYSWKAPVSGRTYINMVYLGASVAVYIGTSLSNLVLVSQSTEAAAFYDAGFYALAGQTYYIAATEDAGYDFTFQMQITAPPAPPHTVDYAAEFEGSFGFHVEGLNGQSFVVEASTNLVNWVRVAIDTIVYGQVDIIDVDATNYPHRFYRVLPLETLFVSPPPAVRLISPSDGTGLSEGSIVLLEAEATDQFSDIASVEFFAGDCSLGTSRHAPFTNSWVNPPPGAYSLTARAMNMLGICSTSIPVQLTISAPPSFASAPYVLSGNFCLAIKGTIGQNFHLLASTDLVTWIPAFSEVLTNSTIVISEPVTNLTRRYFRITP